MTDTQPPASSVSVAATPGPAGWSATVQAWWTGSRIAFGVLFALLVVLWWDSRSQVAALRADMAAQLRAEQEASRRGAQVAREAGERMRDSLARLAALEARIAESQGQQAALEGMYQDLSRNRDEWALAEIEQTLTLAAQQLQLAGNVRGALLALQNADARLGRADRAQFIAVRRVLQRDIERLRALPQVDTTGIAIRLDAVIAAADSLPLVFDEKLKPQPARGASGAQVGGTGDAGATDAPSLWRRLRDDAWDEFRQLVRIRDIENADPVLLNPTQAFFLRENLKLRLLNARIALLQRNEALFRQDLLAASQWLNRYFDVRSRAGANAVSTLNALVAGAVSIELPTLADSLNAVRNFKAPARPAGR
ncbi:MAG: uroporphyrinogen-III C-methyltransferase [Burkholderiales bacterium]|nr:uroporphyrinogen-III C-methyltransferase [Burkholderiales bacterium]